MTEFCDISKCPKDSTICGEISKDFSNEIIVGACISDLYLYVTATKDSSLSILTQYLTGDCDKIEETLFTQCGSMNYYECDKCGDECRLANCIKQATFNTNEQILMSLCLPDTISEDEVTSKCKDFKDVDSGIWKQDCDDSIDIGSVGAGTIIALVFIMMSFFGFVGIVTWYNWKLKTTGTPPFKSHKLCPDVLFPRPPPIRPKSNYKPPDIALQSFK